MTTPTPERSHALPDEDLTDLLNEIRLLLPGTLLLVAFLIALPGLLRWSGPAVETLSR